MSKTRKILAVCAAIALLCSLGVTGFAVSAEQSANLALNATFTANNLNTASVLGSIAVVNDGHKYYMQNAAQVGGSDHYSGNGNCAITRHDAAGYAWYQGDFAEVTAIDQVKVYFSNMERDRVPTDYAIDVLLADGNWKRVAVKYDFNAGGYIADAEKYVDTSPNTHECYKYLTFNFASVECKAFRITANKARKNLDTAAFRVVEIEAYNNSGVAEENYNGTEQDATYGIPYILTNVIADAPVTPSNQLGEYDANRLTDGYSNYADTNLGGTNAIVRYDSAGLGWYEIKPEAAVTVNQVRLFWVDDEAAKQPMELAIDVLQANGVYKRVAELHNYTPASPWYTDFAFETIEAAAIRVTGSKARNASSNNFRLIEIEAYNNVNLTEAEYTGTTADENAAYNIAVPDPILENLAADKPVTANKENTVQSVTYYATNLTDGNKEYNAETQHNAITLMVEGQSWYEIDLGEMVDFNQAKLFLSKWESSTEASVGGVNRRPLDIAVDVLKDDGVYYRVAVMQNIDYTGKEVLAFNFETVSAKAIRFVATNARNADSANWRLMEAEVYLHPALTEEDYTGIEADADYAIPMTQPIMENLVGDKVDSSNTNHSLAEKYPVDAIVDGKTDKEENGAIINFQSDNIAYYDVYLKEASDVNYVKLYLSVWESGVAVQTRGLDRRPNDLAIDVYADGKWVRVAERHNVVWNGVNEIEFKFETVENATCIRVSANNARNKNATNFRMVEIEAYYNPIMTEADYTANDKVDDEKYAIPQEGEETKPSAPSTGDAATLPMLLLVLATAGLATVVIKRRVNAN